MRAEQRIPEAMVGDQRSSERAPPPTEGVAPEATRRRWGRLIFRIVLSLAMMGALLAWADVGDIGRMLGSAAPGMLGLAFLSMLAERVYAAYRWQLLLHAPLPDVRMRDLLRITFASNFLGMFLPGGSIELARVVGLSRGHASKAEAVGSVVLDRVLGLGALLATAGIAAFAASVPLPVGFQAPILLGVAGCAVGLGIALPRRVRHAILKRIVGRAPRFIEVPVVRLSAYLDAIGSRPGLISAAIVHAFGIQIVRILSVALVLWAVGADVTLSTCAAYVPLIIIAQLLPIGIGGLGVREAAFAYFFGMAGVPSAQAIGASLYVYLLTAVSVLPGAWILASASARPRTPQDPT